MDNRLRRLIKEQRAPSPLTDQDLPEIARGITAAVRGSATAKSVRQKGESYVRIQGKGINVVIFKSAWEKVLPYLVDGTLEPLQFPVEAGFRTFNPVTRFDASHIDLTDPLYKRVLGVLQQEFLATFPNNPT